MGLGKDAVALTPYGNWDISNEYFLNLTSKSVALCFGQAEGNIASSCSNHRTVIMVVTSWGGLGVKRVLLCSLGVATVVVI